MRFTGEDHALLINAQIGAGLALLNQEPTSPEGLATARAAFERWCHEARQALRVVGLDNVLAREFNYAGPLRSEVGHDGSFAADVRLWAGEVRNRVRYLARLQETLLARLAKAETA